MSFFSNVEDNLNIYSEMSLKMCLFYYGITSELYRPSKDNKEHDSYQNLYSDEFQDESKINEYVDDITIVLTNQQFLLADSNSATLIDGGYVFTETLLKPGDVLKLNRDDSKESQIKIINPEELGYTRQVIKKYKFLPYED